MDMMDGMKWMFYSDEKSEEQYQKAKEHQSDYSEKRKKATQHEYSSKADTEAD